MDKQPFKKPPTWWSPQLSTFSFKFWTPLRRYMQFHEQRLMNIEVRGIEHLNNSLKKGSGILITPNHSTHADSYCMCHAAGLAGIPFYFMVSWQAMARGTRFRRMILRHTGCFSVDREGTDMQAFRQAVDILQNSTHPLVIFPEGEVYHLNERVTPFLDGPAAIALTAVKKSTRPVVCIPCALKYSYIDDPTDALLDLMSRLEKRVLWRPRPDLSLHERIYRFAQAAIALKEIEYLGHTQNMPLPERVQSLAKAVLEQIETRYDLSHDQTLIPTQVKLCRRAAIRQLEESDGEAHTQARQDLDDLFFVTQLFSYPGDYVSARPSIERIAETLDKFEEDVLGLNTAAIRGKRKAVVTFDKPIEIDAQKRKDGTHALTEQLEQHVQRLLD